ncbi:Pre-mRNA-splicing factor cwf24 [Sphaceloma murrayae]|uniref:Pre-mRNA-splicing factor cwf24 n=1 Tax=Sphaceloma murrayae TaxID=2082308 RepID=A0A2K1QL13_9PEZI|nr:Pre-mRNA-splicing factor cwf24 [Sphaceloma murrayae]
MTLSHRLGRAATLLAVFCSLTRAATVQQAKSTIKWVACGNSTAIDESLECGILNVPLDYTDIASGGSLRLALYRIPAENQPAKGSIVFNFGGPGASTGPYFAEGAGELPVLSNYDYNIIGFDPRGTGNTIPFSCFANSTIRSDVFGEAPFMTSESPDGLQLQWDNAADIASYCRKAMGSTGDLYGTSFVAHDMLQIAEALGEGGKLNYWGFSYGTVLGATFAAMFPDKVGKMILDGNVNVFEYYNGIPEEAGTSTDASLAGFYSSCVANPDKCALAKGNLTATQLQTKVTEAIASLKTKPLDFDGEPLTFSSVQLELFYALYAPRGWSQTAARMEAVVTKNATLWNAARDEAYVNPFADEGAEAYYGIECSDIGLRATQLDELAGPVAALSTRSKVYGDGQTETLVKCARWPFLAKSRFTGPWQTKTSPIFLIGNTYDPITPYMSALNTSAQFDGSGVLRHNGYGSSTALMLRLHFAPHAI